MVHVIVTVLPPEFGAEITAAVKSTYRDRGVLRPAAGIGEERESSDDAESDRHRDRYRDERLAARPQEPAPSPGAVAVGVGVGDIF